MTKASWGLKPGDELVPGRTVVSVLGGGTRFEAFLVSDDTLGTTAVAKALRPDRVENTKAITALKRESRALKHLAHPYIVRRFDAVLDGPRPHLLLEHVEGPTLEDLIEAGPIALEQVLPLGVQLCSALHFIAGAGWVHLDIKPANIIMSVNPTIIDLSAARTIARASALTKPVGTTAFMAPEQCDPVGRGPVGAPADVWGLGVTLYMMLARGLPFPKSAETRYPQMHDDPVTFPAGRVPPRLEAVVMDCLTADPAARPDARAVAEALEPMLALLPSRPTLRRRRPRLS